MLDAMHATSAPEGYVLCSPCHEMVPEDEFCAHCGSPIPPPGAGQSAAPAQRPGPQLS
jgi:hypothetical protein